MVGMVRSLLRLAKGVNKMAKLLRALAAQTKDLNSISELILVMLLTGYIILTNNVTLYSKVSSKLLGDLTVSNTFFAVQFELGPFCCCCSLS